MFRELFPRANWTSGSLYDAYDDAQVGYPTNTYYVLNNNQQVYMVLRQGKSTTGVVQVSTVGLLVVQMVFRLELLMDMYGNFYIQLVH